MDADFQMRSGIEFPKYSSSEVTIHNPSHKNPIRVYQRPSAVPLFRAYSRLRLSSQMVTGPSLVKETFMSAPKAPRATGFPISADIASQNFS
jgi:hypothetical protein